MIFSLHGHIQGITGLVLNPFSISLAPNSSTLSPLLLSSSLDGSVRQWNIDLGICNYSLETGSECLGMKWIKEKNLITYSKNQINIWNLNHYYWTFSFLRAPVIYMRRYIKGKSARILVLTQDYAMRLVCPITGSVLCLTFPPISEQSIRKIVYNSIGDEIYTLLSDGTLTLISTKTNPGKVIYERKSETKESLTVIEGSTIYLKSGIDQKFILFGGTDDGQIVVIDKSQNSRYLHVIQGHSASVLDIKVSIEHSQLYSVSHGRIYD